jgi:hypothetical protein
MRTTLIPRRWMRRLLKLAWLAVVLYAIMADPGLLQWPFLILAFGAGCAFNEWRRRVRGSRGRNGRRRGTAGSAPGGRRRAAPQGS